MLALGQGIGPTGATGPSGLTGATGPAGAGAQTTFVVDTTSVQHANVYPTLAAAAVARRLVDGPAIVEFRQSTTHPAAAYDFRDANGDWITSFVSPSTGVFQQNQTFADGSTLVGVNEFVSTGIVFAGLASTLIAMPPFMVLRLEKGCFFQATGAGGVVAGLAAGVCDIFLYGTSIFKTGSATGAAVKATGGTLVIEKFDETDLQGSTLAQSGLGFVLVISGSPAGTIIATQPGISSGLVQGTNLFFDSSVNSIVGPGGAAPALQAGTATLVGGKLQITANLTPSSVIQLTNKIPRTTTNTSFYTYDAAAFPIVFGLAGNFTIVALLQGADTINIADLSDVGWVIVN